MTTTIIIEKLREVKQGLFKEVESNIETINQLTSDIKHSNLKVHNIAYYLDEAVRMGLLTEVQKIDIFDEIINAEFVNFSEWESENLNYVYRDYIGRTSSFYYSTPWYGEDIDNDTVRELLSGKELKYINAIGNLNGSVYDYLVHDAEFTLTEEEFDEDDLNEEEDLLYIINEDLVQLIEIIEEAYKAYDYLEEYKTESNEYSIAECYLENYLVEHASGIVADELFSQMLNDIEKFNQVELIHVHSFYVKNGTYNIDVIIDDKIINLITNIKDKHKLSLEYISTVQVLLAQKINEKF